MYRLVDFKTQKPVEPTDLVFTGREGPWEVLMDLDTVRQRINLDYFRKSPPFVSKYLPFMPVKDYSRFVSLGEGATPLIQSGTLGRELGIELYFKLENQNPTGSFKDRGSAVEVTLAREMGAPGIAVASTGNMAASCSCYAAAAHIPCFVFAPEDTPPSKLAQVISYGGRIVQVKGSYGDAARLAEESARQLGFYLAGDYAFRIEGHKTAAFELIEQLYFRPPHLVVVPMGCGTNLASYYKGFIEYQSLGLLNRMPRLLGVQSSGAPTIVSAFEQRLADGVRFDRVESIARAICINHALDAAKALDALYKTEGSALAVTDREMLEAQYRLSKDEGLFVETACAATVASLMRLHAAGALEPDQRVVCVLTGAGLKDPTPILKIAVKPPTIPPKVEEFRRLYDSHFFDGKNVAFINRDDVVFSEPPTASTVAEKV
ncbi:MAG: threonine synthase, partial [Bdellovibrionales bacterium]|nr:threonine synthase [Bdellovibrionales bacterium]